MRFELFCSGVVRAQRGVPLGQVQSPVAKRVGISVRRRKGSHIGGSGEHRAFGAPMSRAGWLRASSRAHIRQEVVRG